MTLRDRHSPPGIVRSADHVAVVAVPTSLSSRFRVRISRPVGGSIAIQLSEIQDSS